MSSGEEAIVTYIITGACISEKVEECVMVCPVDCIYDAGDQFVINPDECIDCGSCEPMCPVDAIYRDDELPEELGDFEAKNKDFFRQ